MEQQQQTLSARRSRSLDATEAATYVSENDIEEAETRSGDNMSPSTTKGRHPASPYGSDRGTPQHMGSFMRRPRSSYSLKNQLPKETVQQIGSPASTDEGDRSSGFVRIYYEQNGVNASTVFKLKRSTSVLEVRKSMIRKLRIPVNDLRFYVIVVVYPSESSRSLTARTLLNEECILQLVDKLNLRFASYIEHQEETQGQGKARRRNRQPFKFMLKDLHESPSDADEDSRRVSSKEDLTLNFPVYLGRGEHCGYLHKCSVKDPSVWHKRWFVVKDDQLLYCKSATNQRDVVAISLLNSYLGSARPDSQMPNSFEFRAARRTYQLAASSKEDMMSWMRSLHQQKNIATENNQLHRAEMLITEGTVWKNEEEAEEARLREPSLLSRVLSREDTLKIFRDSCVSVKAQALLDSWIDCEVFRRGCIARQNGMSSRTAKEEWDHLSSILKRVQHLPIITHEDLMKVKDQFPTELMNKRLAMALHTEEGGFASEPPGADLVVPIQTKVLEAIESGPFQQFLLGNGFRKLLERTIGRIV